MSTRRAALRVCPLRLKIELFDNISKTPGSASAARLRRNKQKTRRDGEREGKKRK